MCILSGQVGVREGEWVQVSNYNVGISRRCWGKRSALCAVEGWVGDCSHPPPVFTRLATKGRSLPKGKSANHIVEFLQQLNSVSRTKYILTISHGHTRRLPRLLSHKTITLSFTDRHKNPTSTGQLARHTCFHQANKKEIFSIPPLQSPTQPYTGQRAELPHQQRRVMHTL